MLSHHLIREARRRGRLTQAELAMRAGTTQSAVARWEAGRSLPSLEKLKELVECCGLELAFSLMPRREAEERVLDQLRVLSASERLQRLLAAMPYAEGGAATDATGAAYEDDVFDPLSLLAALERHGVKYVLLGGLAATLHGSPILTTDVDIAPERGAQNLERLAAVLAELGAMTRGGGDPRAWTPDLSATGLARGSVHRLHTRFGPFDLLFEPTGTSGYDDLRQQAASVRLGETTVMVASLSDVIRSKEAAGRTDDRATVATLRRLQGRGPSSGGARRAGDSLGTEGAA